MVYSKVKTWQSLRIIISFCLNFLAPSAKVHTITMFLLLGVTTWGKEINIRLKWILLPYTVQNFRGTWTNIPEIWITDKIESLRNFWDYFRQTEGLEERRGKCDESWCEETGCWI